MSFPKDIYTEPEPDPDTLANLGPLRALAGTWVGTAGKDSHPFVDGTEANAYVEHYRLTPIDAQTNGPQLLYGMHYHTRITKPGEIEAFHDQTGYWLWEPATGKSCSRSPSRGGRLPWPAARRRLTRPRSRWRPASGTRTSASSRTRSSITASTRFPSP